MSEVRDSYRLWCCHDEPFLCIQYITLCSLNLVMFPFIWCVCLCVWERKMLQQVSPLSSSTVCMSLDKCEHACSLPTPTFTLHCFCVGFCVSLHMQVRLRSINVAQGDLWSAAGERNPPLTHSTYTLFGCMIYELCPRVAGFIFLLLTAPMWRLGPLWDEGKEKPDFLTLEYIKRVRMSSSFSLWWSLDGVSEFDVSKSTHWLLL